MGYCELADILGVMDEEDVIQYTNDADGTGVVMDKVDQAIAGATALIDAHLGRRYAVPLDPVPELIRDLACEIAAYKISGRKSAAPEEWRQRYKDGVRVLERLGDGKSVIPGAVAMGSGKSSHSVKFSSCPRIFDRKSMGGW